MKQIQWGAFGLFGALVALGVAHQLAGLPGAFLVGAALTLSLVIALLWASLSHLGGDSAMTFEDALGLAAPTAAEEQKRAVLRALKDLEYELSVGKISAEDFKSVSEHYRSEAKRLIQMADQSLSLGRERAERLLGEQLAATAKEPS